ncbi:hypothetical protein FQA39_LY01100 [Lamprigera yunnana]|nr:hypothetical protein FQA39_LY01100 [Lamprigera yunnana]
MSHIIIGEECDNSNDLGFQILTDEEIIDKLNGTDREEKEAESADVFQVASHAEAFKALDVAFKWFERQDESNPIQLL